MRQNLARAVVVWLVVLAPRWALGQSGPRPSPPPKGRAELLRVVGELQVDLATLEEAHRAFARAALKLSDLYAKLAAKSAEVSKLAARGGESQAQLLAATRQMQEMQMSFNLQYLQLQNQMQNENRQFTMVSNIMKTKHDTVKNSISNIR